MSAVAFRKAELRDIPVLLEMLPLYYAADDLPYDAVKSEGALRMFLGDPGFGRIFMMVSPAQHAHPIGYLILTFGFSFEFGGREAFVDELFVREDYRCTGVGSEAIRHAIDECRREGLAAIRLEVTAKNERAMKLYLGLGFQDLSRSLLAYPLG